MCSTANVVTQPHKDVNAHEDFLVLIVECHILAAAMEVLTMDSLDDEPCTDILPPDVWMHEKEERREIFTQLLVSSSTLVSTYQQPSSQKSL